MAGEKDIRSVMPGVTAQQYLFAQVNALANRLQMVGDRLFEELTWKQWFALVCVLSFPEAPGLMEAAERMGTTHQNMKQLLLRLEKAGFVQLVQDPADRRRTVIQAGEATPRLEAKYGARTTAIMQALFEGISPEETQTTIRTLTRMESNLQHLLLPEKEGP